jgi:hypothetical protein
MEAQQALEMVKKSPTQSKPPMQVHTEMKPGQIHWQGDVGILALKKLPKGLLPMAPIAKLAPGSSRGSRHIVHERVVYRMYRKEIREVTDGPFVVSETEFRVDHPDHGTVVVPPGVYQIRYQRQALPDGRVERVRD